MFRFFSASCLVSYIVNFFIIAEPRESLHPAIAHYTGRDGSQNWPGCEGRDPLELEVGDGLVGGMVGRENVITQAAAAYLLKSLSRFAFLLISITSVLLTGCEFLCHPLPL